MQIDALIFGGGAAGLWLLDELSRRGVSALLLEANALGSGQTVASQGILHGGLKYTLQGLLTKSAEHIRDMPGLWRECLAGVREPRLTETPVRAEFCCLWRTDGFASRMGMIGAKMGLRIAPRSLSVEERPAVLRSCPGTVAKLDEQVVSPAGFIANLADRNRQRILKVDADCGAAFQLREPGDVESVRLTSPNGGRELVLQPRRVVLTAGAGNAKLRQAVGLAATVMQRRPLHMVLVRGNLPVLNGHCVDGKRTRVTITSDFDSAGRTVWQIGGQIAEDGVRQHPAQLVEKAQSELQATIPGVDLSGLEWSTYRVDRAEAQTRNVRRPDTFQVLVEGNTVTAWPTKLVLAPKLAETIADGFADASGATFDDAAVRDWPRPDVARPPWELDRDWISLGAGSANARPAA